MNLLYDLMASQPKKNEKYNGGANFAGFVFQYLCEMAKPEDKIVAFYQKGRDLNPDFLDYASSNVVLVEIEQIEEIPGLIEKYKIERFYTSMPPTLRSLRLKNIHFVFTIHGLRGIEKHWDISEFKYTKSLKDKIRILMKVLFKKRTMAFKVEKAKEAFKICDNFSILTVSNHSRASIMLNLGITDPDKVKVFYPPIFLEESIPEIRKPVQNGKYFLVVSGNRWIKNTYRAIKAFQYLKKNHKTDIKLVITGISAGNPFRQIKDKDIVFYEYIDGDTLNSLYQHCYALVYPTMNEGFGGPPIEAQRFKTPVIAASNTALFEVLGNSVLFFDTYSEMELATRMFQMLTDDELYQDFCERGFQNYKRILDKKMSGLKSMCQYLLS